MFVMFIDIMSAEEARQELQRRRKALELEAMQTQSFESLCSVAHRLGELCEQEDALNNPPARKSWSLAHGLSADSLLRRSMSHHLYSTMTEKHGIVNVVMGYDPSHDHVFCTVRAEGDDKPLYISSEDEQAGTRQQNVEYYRNIFAVLQLSVPESMFVEIQRDQRASNGTRFLVYD